MKMKMNKFYIKFNLSLIFFLNTIFVCSQDSPNIIFLIGDGMGLTQISAGMYANGNSTALEEFEYIGLSKTGFVANITSLSIADICLQEEQV